MIHYYLLQYRYKDFVYYANLKICDRLKNSKIVNNDNFNCSLNIKIVKCID